VVWPRAVTVVLDKLSKHKNCTDKALQLALSWLAQDAGFETKKAILRGRGLDPKEAHTAFGAFMAGVKPADHAALALEIALWSAYYNCFHGASPVRIHPELRNPSPQISAHRTQPPTVQPK